MSFVASRCVAGIAMAPSLWSAIIDVQNCQCRLRMSITRSPRPMPADAKNDAVASERREISAKVKRRSEPLVSVQSNAGREGSSRAMTSTTS